MVVQLHHCAQVRTLVDGTVIHRLADSISQTPDTTAKGSSPMQVIGAFGMSAKGFSECSALTMAQAVPVSHDIPAVTSNWDDISPKFDC